MSAKAYFRRTTLGLAAIVLLLFVPVVTFAETPSDPTNQDQPAVDSSKPEGADAKTYKYNETTGLWENDHYTWNPVTHETKPKVDPKYTYNPETKTWNTTEWKYDAAAQKYVATPVSVDELPAGASIANGSEQAQKSGDTDTPKVDAKNSLSSASGAIVSNNITSIAQSGDALVVGNTSGGSATSGNASSIANILNMLQSSWGLQGSDLTTFMAEINGDVVGDLLINPANFTGDTLPLSDGISGDVDINIANSGVINNDIDLTANSGNATVSSNTSAGDATTGTATAMANVINLINSMVSSGESFVGNININGNLEGDILLPENLQNQLLASNVPRTTLTTSQVENSDVLAEFNNNQSINNNISLNATSGEAQVNGNTSAGNAQTGNASTNLTVFNLTGHEVVGSNAMLVFVNVLGEWVGMIMDAPAGSTAAMIGGGITSNNLNSAALNGSNNTQISNNINLDATSGDATVANNTTAGNATSGNAQASASVSNISNSQFSLADWFGVLFINVLGSWHGSFGVDTPMGDSPNTEQNANNPPPISDIRIFQFTPGPNGRSRLVPAGLNGSFKTTLASSEQSSPNTDRDSNQPQVLGTTVDNSNKPDASSKTSEGTDAALRIALLSLMVALVLLGIERLIHHRTAFSRHGATA